MKKAGLLIGSLRKDSWNRKIAQELIRMAPASLQLQIIEIGDLPFYNSDLDDFGPVPESWTAFRADIAQLDAVLFISPEYNRSIPAVLKNAIDVGSRPYGHNVWNMKPGAVITTTPGGLGAFGANHILRQSMVFLNVPMMQQPEMYIGHVDAMFTAGGSLDPKNEPFLASFLTAFEEWIKRF